MHREDRENMRLSQRSVCVAEGRAGGEACLGRESAGRGY